MKRLSYLDLSETHATDAGLKSLKSLKDLHDLDLNGTSVTAEGVRGFSRPCPTAKSIGRRQPRKLETEK